MSHPGSGERTGKSGFRLSENFFGTATVGERGQIVIPAEARKKLLIETGDKLLVIGHGEKGVMLVKIDAMREFIHGMLEDLQQVENEFVQQSHGGDYQQEDIA